MSSRSAVVIKVPLWRTLGEANRQVLGDLKAVGRYGWLPFLILSLFGIAAQVANGIMRTPAVGVTGAAAIQAALPIMFLGLVSLVVQALCYNAFVVGWYRHVLKAGQNIQTGRGYWPAFWRVLGYYVLLMLGMIVFMSIAVALILVGLTVLTMANWIAPTPDNFSQFGARAGLVGGIVGVVAFGLCFTRASLVFPAAAYGNSLGLRMAWRTMRGNTWRMILAYFLVMTVYLAIALIPALTFNTGAFATLISGDSPRAVPQPIALVIAIRLVSQFVLFLFLALSTSLAAIFYRELVLRPHDVVEVFT